MEKILGYDCQKRLRFSENAGEAWLATKGDEEHIILYIIPKTEENSIAIQTLKTYAELLNRLPAERQQNLLPILKTVEEDDRFLCTTPVADSRFTEQMAELSRSNQQILSIAETLAQTLLVLKEEHFTHIALTPDNLFYKGGTLLLGLPSLLYAEQEFWPPESPTPFQADTDLYAFGKLLYSLDTGLPAKQFPMPAPRETKPEIPAFLLLWSHLSAKEPHARQRYLPTIITTIQDIRSDLTGEKPRKSLFPKKWLLPLEISILFCGIVLYCYTRFHSPDKYASIFEAIANNDASGVKASIWKRGDVNVLNSERLLPIQVALRKKVTTQQQAASEEIINTIINEGGCREVNSAFAALQDIISAKHNRRIFQLVLQACNYQGELFKRHGNEILHAIIEQHYDSRAIPILLKNWPVEDISADEQGLSPLLQTLFLEEDAHALVLLNYPQFSQATSPDGTTPLHLLTDSPIILKKLLELQLDINATTADGSTPLLLAVRKRRSPAIIEALLEHQANPNATDNWGNTPLSEAVRNGDLDSAKLLVQAGAAIHPSLLRVAVLTNRTAILSWLLEQTKTPDVPDAAGRTPLHWAALRNLPDCVTLLLNAQAKNSAKDLLGLTPSDLAFIGDASDVANLLPPCKNNKKLESYRALMRSATPSPYPDGPVAPEILAVLQDEAASEEQLLRATEDLSCVNGELVQTAINHPSTLFLDYLLQKPLPSLNETFLTAVAAGKVSAVSALLRAGADLTAKDSSGQTALERAMHDYRAAHILILCDPDIYLGQNSDVHKAWQDQFPELPDPQDEGIQNLTDFLRIRLKEGNTSAVQYALPHYNLSANFQTDFGIYAIAEGNIELPMMQALLANGANPQLAVCGQQMPLQRSVAIGQPLAFQKLLLDYGANPNDAISSQSPLLTHLLAFYAGKESPSP